MGKTKYWDFTKQREIEKIGNIGEKGAYMGIKENKKINKNIEYLNSEFKEELGETINIANMGTIWNTR